MKLKKLKKYISPILTAAIIFLFVVYLLRHPEVVDRLLNTNPIHIVLIMVIYLLVFFVEGLFISVTLEVFDRHIGNKESFFIATISRIGNYLLPMRAGAILRATYLKKKFNFRYSNFLSTLYGYYIIFFLTSSFLALIVLFLKYYLSEEFFLPLTLFFLGVVLAMIILIFFRVSLTKVFKNSKGVLQKIFSFFDRFIDGWDSIIRKRKLFTMLILISMSNILLNVIVVGIQFFSIGKDIQILDIILYTCISGVSLLVSITPGALGIREGILLITSKSLNLTEQEIVQIAVLDRSVMFLLLLISLLVLTLFFKEYEVDELLFKKEE